jgi:hypothetical protein
MKPAGKPIDQFRALVLAIVSGDGPNASRMLRASPHLATERAAYGATRQAAKENFFDEILRYMYEGDTALHIAASAYQLHIAVELIASGADVRAKNRRGAVPLHYAADGVPGSRAWNPEAQAAVVALLIKAGADPDATDRSGVRPLHRAIRTRCAAAVKALLEGGADPSAVSGNGSTPLRLATQNTGRSGSGSAQAKEQQDEILRLLADYGTG